MPELFSRYKQIVGVGAAIAVVALVATIGAVDSTLAFRACLGVLLSIFGCIQLYVAVALFLNRHESLLELSQPTSLSLFAVSGSVATVGSFMFAVPESNVGCALRQPILLISISLMGSMLVSRSWRIMCIVSPTLAFASATTSDQTSLTPKKSEKIQAARLKVMKVLSKLSEWALVVVSCGRYKAKSARARESIRQQVTLADSMRVLAVLMLPQIILQMTNLSVPIFQVKSIEIDDGMYACQCAAGPWLLVIGVTLAVLPFLVALLLNVKLEGMPNIFKEFDQIASSMKVSCGVLSITLPTIGLISSLPGKTNAHAYLMAASLLSFVLPLCYNITFVLMEACTAKRDNAKTKLNESTLRRMSSLESDGSKKVDSLKTLAIAEDAVKMSKMLKTMGSWEKSIKVNDSILSLFKAGGEYSWEDGFADSDINFFGPKTLQTVVSTMIRSGQLLINSCYVLRGEEFDINSTKAMKICIDSLNIFDQAPAKNSLKDRSVVFPGFSLFASIRNGGIDVPTNQVPVDFGNGVASKFVHETQFQLFHHCRSLAMKAEFLAKNHNYNDALAVAEDIKLVYDPALHSKAISQEYATDHCARVLALSTMWLHHLNRSEEDLTMTRCLNDVIECILPELDKSNMLGLTLVVLPVIRVLVAQGQAERAQNLYNDYIVEAANIRDTKGSPAMVVMKPLSIILKCHATAIDSHNFPVKYDGIENDIFWILNGEEKFPDVTEKGYTNHCEWSLSSLHAEVCLQLAKRAQNGHTQESALIEEGLRLSDLADKNVKNENGNNVTPVACSFHSQIHAELQGLSLSV